MIVGFIGAGNITSIVLSLNKLKFFKQIYIYDINAEKSEELIHKFKNLSIKICITLQELLERCNVIVEAASMQAVDEIFNLIRLKTKFKEKNFVILSVGGILKNFSLYKKLTSLGYKIYIPSGAIAGCDALAAVKYSKIKSIKLTTIKPIHTLMSSDYVLKNPTLYKRVIRNKRCVLYRGGVYKAIKYFPQNINVAATLAVISECPQKIKVTIIADREIKRNIHEIKIASSAGDIYVKVSNLPSPDNPKTSYLAALSTLWTIIQTTKVNH